MNAGKVLWAANTYWTSPFQVGANHLARQFAARGWRVGFFSEAVSPLHLLSAKARKNAMPRFATWASGGGEDLDGRLFYYSPFALWTPQNLPLLRGRWALNTWPRSTIPGVVSVAKKRGFGEVDLLVIDTAPQGFWLDRIAAKRTVYRVTDRLSGFKKATPALIRREEDLARRVDIVVYTAADLREHVEAMRPKRMVYVPNGVNFAHFQGDFTEPEEYSSIPRPRAVYVGAMDVWFDYELVNRAAEALPGVSFVLIGPDAMARQRIRPRPNVHVLGARPYDILPAYLRHADVGIIPFDTANHAELVNGVNPIKLYEYMACGLPVVAVEWAELRNVNSPAVLVKTADGFIHAVEEAANSEHSAQRFVKFSAGQDWGSRADMLLKEIGGIDG